ncbi:MAG TPA: bifunctional [glutamate--ammonia ligase]-adenylyl-L-tyrosine phosphorylase/[glutamate--ammonia-ligase] adenylyltransferase, partial [Porticoccaceae bacterium]|nr:bifunctional [glutamate--ammonia ligase]-adenylyl-L-tyrosine phosphorylase/[glutamate--ammonia-ligase] adenylyltransferase [Porticoccaceae bacterium]
MTQQLSDLPPLLQARVERFLERFRESAPEELGLWLDACLGDADFSEQLFRVWAGSEFVANTCVRHPEVFRELVESGDLECDDHESTPYQRCLEAVAQDAETPSEREATLHRQLRRFRRYQMLRIVWRDLAGVNTDAEQKMLATTREMSLLADAVIVVARDKLHRWLCESWGTPTSALSGVEQHLLVLGMGKLGAWELNVSSDIDLIFAYPESGETTGVAKTRSNQEFFTRLAQKLIQALDNTTVDGQVFRVDMRLRPYGGSGALALSFDAMEEYYQNQGRDWERYAMVKSRVIGVPGSDRDPAADNLERILRAFTYRRYTDFSVIQSLRDMKAMINLEVQRRGLSNNIKLGHGGIREVEFIAQAFQLVWGGRDQRFQQRELRAILRLLDEEQSLPDGAGAGLWQAYVFLRNLEHVLQGWRDEQTQELPGDDGDSDGAADRARVAFMMGYSGWDACIAALENYRDRVKGHFQALVADDEAEQENGNKEAQSADASVQLPQLEAAWLNNDVSEFVAALTALDFDDPGPAADRLHILGSSQKVLTMPVETRARLDRLMPQLILACAGVENSTEALARVLQLVESVARRSAYLVLLIENTQALQQLVTLCAASPWISQS